MMFYLNLTIHWNQYGSDLDKFEKNLEIAKYTSQTEKIKDDFRVFWPALFKFSEWMSSTDQFVTSLMKGNHVSQMEHLGQSQNWSKSTMPRTQVLRHHSVFPEYEQFEDPPKVFTPFNI